MINKTTKERLALLCLQYTKLAKKNKEALREIALAEISEMVYNSNAIENSTLSLDQTEAIILHHTVLKQLNTREVHEAQNLARVTTQLLTEPMERLSVKQILALHRTLLTGIEDGVAGKFRSGKEWVRVGSHLGINPPFVPKLMESLHKRIALLENGSIILLSRWAQQNGVKGNVAANKAKRQTIPAFRLKEKWMIAESYRENTEDIDTFHA